MSSILILVVPMIDNAFPMAKHDGALEVDGAPVHGIIA
jgi:hypothetical protein